MSIRMKAYFKNKVVFITGSSKGIGKATALLLAGFGSKVCINGRSLESLEETRRELEEREAECLALPGDVSDSYKCKEMVEQIISHFGRLDILINNAGIASHGKVRDLTVEAWDRVVGINLLGPVNMTTWALPHILESKGSILFISSPAGKVGVPGHSSYSVSKMGLTAFASAMQIELEKTGVHTGIIYVGFTENEENKQILNPDGTYRKLPARRQVKAAREEVAKAIARAIYKRKKSVTLSAIGKLQSFALRFCPFLVTLILKKANRDYETMYDG